MGRAENISGVSSTVSILGCGWLGLPLAQFLIQEGFSVKGSTTSDVKLAVLKEVGVKPYLLDCNPEINAKQLSSFFESDILFLNIPFRRTLEDPRYYQQQIQSVIMQVKDSPIKQLIFASSTSVYPDDMGDALEDKVFTPANERAQVLFDIEDMLLSNDHFSTVILRFSGLYGGTRKIGQFMAGKQSVRSGDSPVNLVHLDDCIRIVHQVIQKGITNDIFNVCSDKHPLRKDLYKHAAKMHGLTPPSFSTESSTNKVVSNTKLKRVLNYEFIYPDPMEL